MTPLTSLVSTAVPIPMENIDTDQIIPARFLKATSKDGFGDNLFRDWRYDKEGRPNPDFVLNDPTWSGHMLIAGKNFGCGSSREHAAWALAGYGFRVVISSFFADIFQNNALNNGILPIQVEQSILDQWMDKTMTTPSTLFDLSLETQTISAAGISTSFDLNPYKKTCLMNGYDDIDYLLNMKDRIAEFEVRMEKKGSQP